MSLYWSVRKIVRFAFIVAAMAAVLTAALPWQARGQDTADRKVKFKISPQYPEIARKIGLTGIVRIEVVVAPNGKVKETKVIGGHPILVNAAVDAVKQWKFDLASADTTSTLEFKFQP